MADDISSSDSRTMESVVLEDVSLNQSQTAERPSIDPGTRPVPTMVPVVFEKDDAPFDKKEGKLVCSKWSGATVDRNKLIIMLFERRKGPGDLLKSLVPKLFE